MLYDFMVGSKRAKQGGGWWVGESETGVGREPIHPSVRNTSAIMNAYGDGINSSH